MTILPIIILFSLSVPRYEVEEVDTVHCSEVCWGSNDLNCVKECVKKLGNEKAKPGISQIHTTRMCAFLCCIAEIDFLLCKVYSNCILFEQISMWLASGGSVHLCG